MRPWTFFENGMVGHVSMADPFDVHLSKAVHDAISRPGVLEGEGVKAHSAGTVICIGMIVRYRPTPPYERYAKNIALGQKAPSSQRARNPSSTAPSPRSPRSP